jgi:hypothetical protein
MPEPITECLYFGRIKAPIRFARVIRLRWRHPLLPLFNLCALHDIKPLDVLGLSKTSELVCI